VKCSGSKKDGNLNQDFFLDPRLIQPVFFSVDRYRLSRRVVKDQLCAGKFRHHYNSLFKKIAPANVPCAIFVFIPEKICSGPVTRLPVFRAL
jgi:hypothetical protein